MVLVVFKEEVQRILEDALLEQKLTERILNFARPTCSTERTLGWIERTNKMYPEAACSPLDWVSSLFWSSGFSDAPRMLFLSLQVLGATSTHSLFNIKHVSSEQLSLYVLSTINRELSYSSKISSNTTLKPNTLLFVLSLTQL